MREQTQVIKKYCTINEPKMVNFHGAFTNLYKLNFCVVLNIMHGLAAVNMRICLAPKNHGYLKSAHSYDFYPHLAQLDNLDFTLSHNKERRYDRIADFTRQNNLKVAT